MQFFEHLEAMYRNLPRRIDSDSSLIASNLNDRDLDVVANDDRLAYFTGEDEHPRSVTPHRASGPRRQEPHE